LQEALGVGDEESFKAATVLSGGVAGRGETCGALLGALMALGLAMGRSQMADTPTYRRAMAPALDLSRRFQQALQAAFGFDQPLETTLCRDIHTRIYGRAFDLTDKADYERFLTAGGHSEDGCPKVCAVAARTAAEFLIVQRPEGRPS
jgi:C_GCAxxG_C_C family probable redox protein